MWKWKRTEFDKSKSAFKFNPILLGEETKI